MGHARGAFQKEGHTVHKTGRKKESFKTTLIGFLTKFPTFLHNHPAHRGNYCNAKLI